GPRSRGDPDRRAVRARHRDLPARRRGLVPRVRPAGAGASRRGGRPRRARRAGAALMLSEIFFPKRMWRTQPELKRRYDVVIVGGGSHGLATAYYLAKRHGIRDVAVLEKAYIGSGASGRNTTIIRSNYRTPEGAAFYGESVRLYERLSDELDFNLMFSQ